MAAPSAISGRWRDIVFVGMRLPRRARWVARRIATLICAFIMPLATEHGRSYFVASLKAMHFNKVLASFPRSPSVETENGEKCRR